MPTAITGIRRAFSKAMRAGEWSAITASGATRLKYTICREDLVANIARHVDSTVHLFEKWGLPIWKTDADGVRHKVYNIGNHESVALLDYIAEMERALYVVGPLSRDGVRDAGSRDGRRRERQDLPAHARDSARPG